MRIGQIRPAKGATKARKRRGLGPASGLGGTAGKGHKGQLARTGGKVARWFEGGQMPIQRRLPKVGFKRYGRVDFQVVNIESLSRFGTGEKVTRASLQSKRLIDRSDLPVKILGTGELGSGVALAVDIDAISASARAKIESAGGTVTLPAKMQYRARHVRKERGAKGAAAKGGRAAKGGAAAKGGTKRAKS